MPQNAYGAWGHISKNSHKARGLCQVREHVHVHYCTIHADVETQRIFTTRCCEMGNDYYYYLRRLENLYLFVIAGVSITFEEDAWTNQCKRWSLLSLTRAWVRIKAEYPAVRGKSLTNTRRYSTGDRLLMKPLHCHHKSSTFSETHSWSRNWSPTPTV